jgi:hypothetical protein
MTDKVLTHCYSFANGMVMAFDQNGEQMPEYQGTFKDVYEKIKRDFPSVEITSAFWRADV